MAKDAHEKERCTSLPGEIRAHWTQCWEKSLEFHLLVPCVGELTWSPQAAEPLSPLGTLSLGCCATIATGSLQSERKWSHKSPWNNFRKAFHEAARTENHYCQGVNEKEWKTLYLPSSCHSVWIRRINLVAGAICCSRCAEGGLGSTEQPEF